MLLDTTLADNCMFVMCLNMYTKPRESSHRTILRLTSSSACSS
jgi:hypothetical protein